MAQSRCSFYTLTRYGGGGWDWNWGVGKTVPVWTFSTPAQAARARSDWAALGSHGLVDISSAVCSASARAPTGWPGGVVNRAFLAVAPGGEMRVWAAGQLAAECFFIREETLQ